MKSVQFSISVINRISEMYFRPKRIYYVPGIISLVMSPFFFYFYAEAHLKSMNRYAIEINWFNPELAKMYPTVFRDSCPPKRKYATINISGDDKTNQTQLDIARQRIKEIISKDDSSAGVHFIFGNQSKYGTFIQALDILQAEGAKAYLSYKNNLWFYHVRISSEQDSNFDLNAKYGCLLCNDVIISKTEKSTWEVILEQAAAIWGNGWQMIIAFILFLFSIAMLKRVK